MSSPDSFYISLVSDEGGEYFDVNKHTSEFTNKLNGAVQLNSNYRVALTEIYIPPFSFTSNNLSNRHERQADSPPPLPSPAPPPPPSSPRLPPIYSGVKFPSSNSDIFSIPENPSDLYEKKEDSIVSSEKTDHLELLPTQVQTSSSSSTKTKLHESASIDTNESESSLEEEGGSESETIIKNNHSHNGYILIKLEGFEWKIYIDHNTLGILYTTSIEMSHLPTLLFANLSFDEDEKDSIDPNISQRISNQLSKAFSSIDLNAEQKKKSIPESGDYFKLKVPTKILEEGSNQSVFSTYDAIVEPKEYESLNEFLSEIILQLPRESRNMLAIFKALQLDAHLDTINNQRLWFIRSQRQIRTYVLFLVEINHSKTRRRRKKVYSFC